MLVEATVIRKRAGTSTKEEVWRMGKLKGNFVSLLGMMEFSNFN